MAALVRAYLAVALLMAGQRADREPDQLCGPRCLYLALRALGKPVRSLAEVRRSLGPPTQWGYSMDQLAICARVLGAEALVVQASLRQLANMPPETVVIALLMGEHFVVVQDWDDDEVTVIDPP